jgi:hypothetical protein
MTHKIFLMGNAVSEISETKKKHVLTNLWDQCKGENEQQAGGYGIRIHSDVLAWLGLEASGFGLALSGFGFQDPQAKP